MSQHRVTLQAPKHSRPYWLFALFSPLCIAGGVLAYIVGAPPAIPLLLAGAFALFAYGAGVEASNRRCVVVLEVHGPLLTVAVSRPAGVRVWRYELAHFAGVASYLTPERFARSRAELLCTNGRDGLLLVQGVPYGGEEHSAVVAARALVSQALGVADLGFVGIRPRACQLRANAA